MLRSPLQILFSQSPLCSGLTDEEAAQVFSLFDVQEFEAGTPLYREGETASSLYVVLEGLVSVSRQGRKVAEIGPGSSIGEMGLFQQHHVRSATIMPLAKVTVLCASQAKFQAALRERRVPAMLVANLAAQFAERLSTPPALSSSPSGVSSSPSRVTSSPSGVR